MSPGDGFRFKAEDRPFRDYVVKAPLRRNELYEQYSVLSPAEIPFSLKYVLPIGTLSVETLVAAAQIESLRLVRLLDFGRTDAGDVFVVTENSERTLRQRMAEGPLGHPAALELMIDLLRALKSLENRFAAPKYVSPESVILRSDGVQLDDYYLASIFGSPPAPTWSAVFYASPEADKEVADFRASLYSVGAIGYEALVGHPPFVGTPFEVISRARSQEPDLSPLPEDLQPLFKGLLARDPAARYTSAGAVLSALGSAATSHSSEISAPAAAPVVSGVAAAPSPAQAPARPTLEPLGRNAEGFEEFRRGADAAIMIKIPGGRVRLGTATGGPKESPVVEVDMPPFLIDKYPITWKQFLQQHQDHPKDHCSYCARKAGILPSAFLESPSVPGKPTEIERTPSLNAAIKPNHPVVCVTWTEAQAYAQALGVELPSEAEWETAYRSGRETAYYWGDEPDAERACFVKNSGGGTRPVGERSPNSAGLSDMAGNVSEYCRDVFLDDIFARVAQGRLKAEDFVAGVSAGGMNRAARNGGWSMSEKSLTATFRVGYPPETSSNVRGFRCAISRARAPEWARIAFESA